MSTIIYILTWISLFIIVPKIQNKNLQTINGKESIPVIEFSRIKEKIKLTTSLLFNKASYLKLETKDDIKLGSVKWKVGNKYIIGYAYGSGFYQFTAKGEYIRKLANFGRGPQEVYFPTWTIAEDENLIYIYDQLKPKSFLCIDLNSGIFNKSIPIPIEGFIKNFEFINDSVIICAPIMVGNKNGSNYALFWQSLSGKLIYAIPSGEKSKPEIPNENLLYKVGEQIHYKPIYGDTIFQVNGFKLYPYLILKVNNPTTNFENSIGTTSIEVFLETCGFFLIQTRKIKSKYVIGQDMIANNSEVKEYFIDKKTGKSYFVSSFLNDFTTESWMPYSFVNQNSKRMYVAIDAPLIIKAAKKLKTDSNIMIKDREKIINLGEITSEFDNPILIIDAINN
jgi:hypothetical protein